jgi:hypothetical protein
MVFMLVIMIALNLSVFSVDASAVKKKCVIVLTDFFKDPDDKQSMVWFLTYANEFDVEGLIATSLAYGTGEVHPGWIAAMIDDGTPKLTSHRRLVVNVHAGDRG